MNTVDEYIKSLSDERQQVINRLRDVINTHIPEGFREEINYGMIGWVVPHEVFPSGYHCDPSLPLPFMNLASQKNHVGLYHMGIYADADLLAWFVGEYPKHCSNKLDMGKSCIRFKNMSKIPYDLIGELVSKMSVDDWICRYEESRRR